MPQYPSRQPPAPAAIESTPVLLAYALALEIEASERYADLAEQMNTHNNPEVAAVFAKLSRIERLHANQVLEQAASIELPDIGPTAYQWEDAEGPETVDFGDVDRQMAAHQALKLALHNERRAYRFFSGIAADTAEKQVAELAVEMAEEEAEHVALMEDWLTRYPAPDTAPADDPDPPVSQD